MSERLAICGGTPVRSKRFIMPPRNLGQDALENLSKVLQSGQLNRMGGTWVTKFEEEFAKFYGAKFCTASTSGTSAIHLALGALNPDPGDEVITAPITDMGTIIPILAQNAIPVFADVQLDTGNVDPDDVERRITPRTRAILPVHLGGNPCDMDRLEEIAQRHGLLLIEDCSQAYCAEFQGRRVGTIGDIGCFSMQQSKHLTVGDGGLTITNNPELGDKVRLFADKGWPRYSFDGARDYLSFGFNYRMTELQGAMGVSALSALPTTVENRVKRGVQLTALLDGLPGIHPQRVSPGNQCVYWMYWLRAVEDEIGVHPTRIVEALRAEGVPCGYQYIGKPIFMYEAIRAKRIYGSSAYPFDLQDAASAVRYEEGECPNCERTLNEMITVAIHENFSEQDVKDIATAFAKVIENVGQLKD